MGQPVKKPQGLVSDCDRVASTGPEAITVVPPEPESGTQRPRSGPQASPGRAPLPRVKSLPALGIYVHWPYCSKICPYCDFNVWRPRGADPAALVAAILVDLSAQRRLSGRRPAQSIYFGGGSPALMRPRDISAIIAAVDTLWGLVPGAEISLECNPTDLDEAGLDALRDAGINRLSIGVQAFDDAGLRSLGRHHSRTDALRTVTEAQKRFLRVSFDLIYARPGQKLDDWQRELGFALDLGVEHVSLYELTIEPDTAFGRQSRRGTLPPAVGSNEDFFLATRQVAASGGYVPYEVSNFSRRTEARAQHNLLYWRAQDWAGAGPGAHGRLTRPEGRIAFSTFLRPERYIEAAERGNCFEEADTLSPTDAANEALIFGLRLAEGVDRNVIRNLAGRDCDAAELARLQVDGVLETTSRRIRATERAAGLADALARRLAFRD